MAIPAASSFVRLGLAVTGMHRRAALAHWSLGRSVTLAFAVGMLFVAAIGLLALRTDMRQDEIGAEVASLEAFQRGTAGILTDILDTQSHLLAYLVGGEKEHARAASAAAASAQAGLNALQALKSFSTEATRQRFLPQIDELVKDQLDWQRRAIDAGPAAMSEEARAARVEQGEHALSSLRRVVDQVGRELRQRVEQLELDADRVRRLASAITVAGTALGLLIVLATLLRLNTAEGRRRLATHTLRANEARMRAVSESASEAMVTTDAAGHIVDWNPAAEHMFGYTQAQARGQELTMVMPARFHQRHRNGLSRRLADGARPLAGRAVEVYGLHQDGSEFPLELTVSQWGTEEGRFFTGVMRDITERRRAQAATKAAEQRFRSIVDSTDGIVWEADATTFTFTFISPQAQRLLGYPVADWCQPGFWVEHLHPDDKIWAPQYCASCTRKLEPHDFEYRFIARDGRTVWLHDIVTVVAENGAPRWLRGLMVDVTQRKALEAELKKLALAVEQNPHAIVIAGLQAEIEYVNPAFVRSTGYSPEEVIGRNPRLLQSGKTPATTYQALWAALTQGRTWSGEFINKRKDGSEVVERAVITPLRQSDGRITHYVAANEDVTAARAAEQQLRKLAQAVEQSPESIVITNLDAEIEYVNEAFVRATGYSRGELIGSNPRLLHSGKTPRENYAAMWTALRDGRAWQGEFYNRRKDGSEYIEFALVSPIRQADGSVTHYLAVKEDVTEKRRQSAELELHRHHLEALVQSRTAEMHEAQRRAEGASAAKTSFLANMSHEIRTPMNAILGLAHLLRAGAAPEQAERIDKIGEAGRHLMLIINDILDLSKIEAGKLQLEQQDFALGTVLDHVRSMVLAAAEAKGLVVEIDGDDVSLWLRGDPTRLRQALLNYAGNAVKFTHSGTIWLRARLLHEDEDGLLVRFEAADTGVGIAPEQLPRLFQAFEQGDASTTRKYGGSGLGLAIVRRLAQLMQGDVGVQSTPDVGSTFWFTARLQRGQAGAPARSALPMARAEAQLRLQHAGARLLLVEDNETNREVALHLLVRLGLAVDTAVNGRQALEMESAQPYELILMDVQMPVMDGLDATRAIRALPGRQTTPILALTANAFDEDRRACIDAGMNDYIIKPIDMESLNATLLKWLARSARGAQRAAEDTAEPA